MVKSATEQKPAMPKVVTIKSNKNKRTVANSHRIDSNVERCERSITGYNHLDGSEGRDTKRGIEWEKKVEWQQWIFWFDPKQSKVAYKKLICCRWWFHTGIWALDGGVCVDVNVNVQNARSVWVNLLRYEEEHFVLYMLSVFVVYQLLLPQPQLVPSTGTHRSTRTLSSPILHHS